MQFQVVCRSNRCLHIKWEKPCFRKGVFTESSHFKQLGGSNGVPGTDRGCVKSRRTGLQLIPPCQDEKPIIYCQRPPVTVTNKGYCYWMVGRPNNPNIYHLSVLCFWGDLTFNLNRGHWGCSYLFNLCLRQSFDENRLQIQQKSW